MCMARHAMPSACASMLEVSFRCGTAGLTCRTCVVLQEAMKMVAAEGSSGCGNCMVAHGASDAAAAPIEMRPHEETVAETDDTPAEQQCEHFSIRGYVALVQKDPKFCSLAHSFQDQQQYDENHNSLCPLSVAHFRRWDCSKCLDKAKAPDHRTTARTVSVKQNGSSDSCSISFVRSTLMPFSVDSKRLFPCTQQLSQGKDADRSTISKSAQESNSECNSPSDKKGFTEANTDPFTKDLQGPSYNYDAPANISDNASVDVMVLPEVSQIKANKEGNGTEILCRPKLSKVTLKPNADENGKDQENLIVDCSVAGVRKPISGQKGDQICNNGPREEAASKRSIESNSKKKKKKKKKKKNNKPTAHVGVSDVKLRWRKRKKLRSLSEIINTDQVGVSRSDVEVDHGKVADLYEDDRSRDDVIPVSHQIVGEIRLETAKNKKKYKGVDVLNDGSSLMNWMKRIPKKLRTDKKDSEHKDFDSSVGKLSTRKMLPTTSTQQGDENIQNNKLERNMQGTDGMHQIESENSTQGCSLKVKTANLSKRKMPSTANVQHDVIPVSHQSGGQNLLKTTETKPKFKGDDVGDDGSSLMNWLKRTPRKLRTEKKDSEHKDFDSSVANSKSTANIFASEDMHHDFLSSVGKLGKSKLLSTSTQQGDKNVRNNHLERNMENAHEMCQIEPENSTQRCLSKGKNMSSSKRKMTLNANAQHGDENTERNTGKRTVLRVDDKCQMEPGNSAQKCLAKVSLGKRDIQKVTAFLEQKLPKKRKKQKVELMHEKQAILDDIPMDIVSLLVKNQHERQLTSETDSGENSKITADDDCTVVAADDVPNFASTVLDTNFQQKSSALESNQKKLQITADEDCTTVAAEDVPNYASTVPDTNFQQKSSALESNQKELQEHVASITQATSTHPLKLPIPDYLKSSQEQQTHLCMEEVVTIAASSPLLSQHKDQYITESPAECWSQKGTKELMWESFKTAPRDSSTATCGAQFRSGIRAVDLNSTHVTGASDNYPTHHPAITALNYGTMRTFNQVQARSFPGTISTMEAGNLYDRRSAGQSGFYPKETMPATHLHRLTDSSMLAGFANYDTSNRNQMEFQLRNSHHSLNQYKVSASSSYGSNLDGKVPLTLEDLSRHQLQPNFYKPLRPHPRVGVLSSLLQKEIANWSESCGTHSGYKIGVSKGITSSDMNKKENIMALNSGMFSANWNALQLGSVSSNPEFLSARNSMPQFWTRGQGKMTHPLDKLVRQDICVTNRNPAEFTTISDNNEYIR